jgi:hypothetical protein
MAVLPGVLGCSFDEGTCPERSEGGQAHPATYRSGAPRAQHPAVARWHAHLHGLATAIHELSGLAYTINWTFTLSRKTAVPPLGQPGSYICMGENEIICSLDFVNFLELTSSLYGGSTFSGWIHNEPSNKISSQIVSSYHYP